jgi:hypothetical protein
MFVTICSILLTLVAFAVTAFVTVVSFAAVLLSEMWTLAVQITPYVSSLFA